MAVPQFDPSAGATQERRKALALSIVGLAVFLGWEALSLSSYIRRDTRPPAWDQAVHMEIALDYHQALGAGDWGKVIHLAPKPGMPPFPPLYHLLIRRAYDSPEPLGAALWTNWFYMALLCIALFALAWEFRPDPAALAVTIAFAASPAVQRLYTTQLVDLAVAALAAAAFWALVRSEGFTKWLPSLAFGGLFAVGMLHKWSFFSYMFPAYYLGLVALSESAGRLKALAALALALALFLPWYLVHLPVLLPRLFQASADFAIPVWRGGAFFHYFLETSEEFGPPFWALAWIALLVPQYRRNFHKGWMIPFWVAASYVFWAIVPNRQMRFLLPGLTGLAVALVGAWPPVVLWGLAALQLFSAANFSSGWISTVRIPFPFHPLVFLPSDPPVKEDWQIAAILRDAERLRDPRAPFANLTLVANSARFNGPTFTWMGRQLGIAGVRVRGVNRRLCEFSEFLALKTGDLGDSAVTRGLPEAAKVVTDRSGWFQRAYEEVGRYPLPDKSEAVLFRRRRLQSPPFKDKALTFQVYNSGPFRATNFKVQLGPWDAETGVYSWVKATADELTLRGLKAEGVSIELDKVAFVPSGPDKTGPTAWDDVRFLKLGTLRVKSLGVAASDLADFLEERIKGLSVRELELDGGGLRIKGALRAFSMSARVATELSASPAALTLTVQDARVGASPAPGWLLGPFQRVTIPFEPNPETPFRIELAGLSLRSGRLSVP